MINKIILFSIKNKLIIGLMMLTWIGLGIYSMQKVPVDAVPDITNNQVQVITVSPNLGTEDIEQFVTYPVELAMANLPNVIEIRSISRFGLSVVTIVFEDDLGTYLPRQLVSEKLAEVKGDIPSKFGEPFIGPISTGLGEIYQYSLEVEAEYEDKYSPTDLRTYQDWIVKRQMAMVPGVIEVNSFGGNVKQYEVGINPEELKSMGLNITDIFNALEANNENTGGAYIVKDHKANFIKGEGLMSNIADIENTVVKTIEGKPILIKDVAQVKMGKAIRYGAVSKNGKEAVGGMVMMLKGANSEEVIKNVKDRVLQINKSLPKGISIVPFLDRSDLVNRTTSTVTNNLLEGGLIVIFILVLFLGNFRGGLIVASTIPLSLLFAYIMMNYFGVWSNLMSLGAIDFGIIVDGAVIIIESVVFYTTLRIQKLQGQALGQEDLDDISYQSSSKMMNAAFFGQLIILIVFVPILTLEGIEGKMFGPMAMTFSFAVIGAMLLCLTYVPMVSSLLINKKPSNKLGWGDKFINWMTKIYEPILVLALKRRIIVLSTALVFFLLSVFTFTRMGGEFVPQLDEGDIAMHAILRAGSSLDETEKVCHTIEKTLSESFDEIKMVVSKIGVAEIPTDPMPMDLADMFLILKPQDEWVNFETKEELIEMIQDTLAFLPGVNYEFSQPVEMRFNELMTGVRQDVAVKLFGEDLDVLANYAEQMGQIISTVKGVGDIKVESTQGLPQMTVQYNRQKMAQYGLKIKDVNTNIRTAFSGETAGVIFEGEKRFDLVVRLNENQKNSINDLKNLFVTLEDGNQIPLSEVAKVDFVPGPMQISREGTKRRTYVGINVRGRDVESVVSEIKEKLEAQLDLPPGYYIEYGGSFENLERAKARLIIVVPIALILIFVLLYFALKSFSQTVMIYIAIPLSAIGGIFALWIRDMPFSISAGVGFIVLFGVAVLNGLVLISSMNELKEEGVGLKERILKGTKERIRPIFLTASTDILGFLPMAVSTSAGAEVQQPLATVVIGGMLTASFLTLIVIPILYQWLEGRQTTKKSNQKSMKMASIIWLPLLVGSLSFQHNGYSQSDSTALTLDNAIELALNQNGNVKAANLEVERLKQLQKTAYGLDKTDFGVQYGQYNSLNTDLGFSIDQNFKFPTLYRNQKGLNEAYVTGAEQQKIVTQNDLIKEVKLTFYQILYFTQIQELLVFQDSLYTVLLEGAKLKQSVGEGTPLDQMTAETKLFQIHSKMNENLANIQIYKAQLMALIFSDRPISEVDDSKPQKEFNLSLDSTQLAQNPQLQYYKNRVEIKEQEYRLSKSNVLPEFSVGYFNLSMAGNYQVNGVNTYLDQSYRFQGVQATVAIPIFVKDDLAKQKAAQIDKEIAQLQVNNYQVYLNGQFERVVNDYLKYKGMLDYYQKSALPHANQMVANATKSFQAGDISYMDLVQVTSLIIETKSNYLNTLNNYNQSVIAIEYIMGEK
ncbi:MAG: CusA/CzcA family heavy metal efflux RND transporter [Putridiphycobacter sp.]